ncbi:MAG: radical SAM family heme chaperone HemW [Kiritimatiellae bacterium]|nr:radical SAM family heme chaperone HemW [Kiritimatiellia bacterium]
MLRHLYIHTPFCGGKCAYCGFYSETADALSLSRYPVLPARELRGVCGEFGLEPRLHTLYLGGGTPSLLGADGLSRMVEAVRAVAPLEELEEFTVEVNPADADPRLFETLSRMGVTRLSFGAQSFDDAVLREMGRRHDAAQILTALREAREAGFADVGIDLIAGWPGVGESAWRTTLEQAVSLDLCHVSVYALTLEPGTRLAKRVADGAVELPGETETMDALVQAQACLEEAGFIRYEISNYAKPGFACRHNLAVWRGEDYLGLGPSAASRIGRLRWTNRPDRHRYEKLFAGQRFAETRETRSEEEDALERVLFRLRLAEGIDVDTAVSEYPVLACRYDRWRDVFEGLARQGIVGGIGKSRWRLTPRGFEVCDAVLRELE